MAATEQPGRPWEYSAFQVTVAAKRWISPAFVRVTLEGQGLHHFAPWGLDQRIKLVLPRDDGSLADFGLLADPTPHPREWYAAWKALPLDERNVLRTYTPSAVRPASGQIDVDLFIHEPAGPASAWAVACTAGDSLVVTGPDARMGETGYGIHFAPPTPPQHALLIGDESALPAIANIAAARGHGTQTSVILELANPEDNLLATDPRLAALRGLHVTEVARAGHAGKALVQAAADWGRAHGARLADDPTAYAWIAGEASATTSIRRYLTTELSIAKDRVAFLGYWKHGGPLVG